MIVDDVLDLIEQKIIKGEEVKISNFGGFFQKEQKFELWKTLIGPT